MNLSFNKTWIHHLTIFRNATTCTCVRTIVYSDLPKFFLSTLACPEIPFTLKAINCLFHYAWLTHFITRVLAYGVHPYKLQHIFVVEKHPFPQLHPSIPNEYTYYLIIWWNCNVIPCVCNKRRWWSFHDTIVRHKVLLITMIIVVVILIKMTINTATTNGYLNILIFIVIINIKMMSRLVYNPLHELMHHQDDHLGLPDHSLKPLHLNGFVHMEHTHANC